MKKKGNQKKQRHIVYIYIDKFIIKQFQRNKLVCYERDCGNWGCKMGITSNDDVLRVSKLCNE